MIICGGMRNKKNPSNKDLKIVRALGLQFAYIRRIVCKRLAYCPILRIGLQIAFRRQVLCKLFFNTTASHVL